MKQVKEQVCAYINDHQQEMFSLLKKMIKVPSTQYKEKEIQQLVMEKLKELQMEIDCWEPDFEGMKHHPYFVSPRTSFVGSPNVVGILKGSGGGKSIILNGHIDVVPEGDLKQWNDSPYSGREENGRIYGRGSTDMKGGNVALLYAIEAIQRSGIHLKGDVLFQSVIEEESGGAGSLATLLRGYEADGVIIPEPTKMKFFPKQQGSAWFRLIIKGKSAHGGTRYEGISAIEKAMIVHQHVLHLEKQRNEGIRDPLYANIPIPLPINIGVMKGGQWPSSVCDEVVLEGRYGVGPEETIHEAKAQFETWIKSIGEKDQWFNEHPVVIEWFGAQWIPSSLEEDHELCQRLKENYQYVLEEEPVVEASPWGTDGGLFAAIGSMPVLVFGPGETKVAHFPNEYIEKEKVLQVAKIIATFLLDWCGVERKGEK